MLRKVAVFVGSQCSQHGLMRFLSSNNQRLLITVNRSAEFTVYCYHLRMLFTVNCPTLFTVIWSAQANCKLVALAPPILDHVGLVDRGFDRA